MNPINNKALEVDITEDIEQSDFSISAKGIDHIMHILSTIYSNPIEICVQEYLSNAYDANLAAKSDNPIIIRLVNTESDRFIEFIDYGTGLDKEGIKIFSTYGLSTKRSDDNAIGGFGIGSKSAYSYTDTFFIDTWVDNVCYQYCATKNEYNKPILLELNTFSDIRENGTTVRIPIATKNDAFKFIQAISNKTLYFDNIYYEGDDIHFLNDSKIIEHDLFKITTGKHSAKLELLLGQVPYKVQFQALGIPEINLPVAIKIPLNSGVKPSPTREDIVYNEESIKYVKRIIAKVIMYFVAEYNKKTDVEVSSLKEFKHVNNNHNKYNIDYHGVQIELNSKIRSLEFVQIKDLNVKYSDYKFLPLLVKEYLNIDKFYEVKYRIYQGTCSDISNENNNFSYNSENNTTYLILGKKTLKKDSFIKTLHSLHNKVLLAYRKPRNLKYYAAYTNLRKLPKQQWKAYLEELKRFQLEFEKEFLNSYDDLEYSKDFEDSWNVKYQRASLESGQVKLQRLRVPEKGGTTFNSALENENINIDDLSSNTTQYIFGLKEERETLDLFWSISNLDNNYYYRNRREHTYRTIEHVKPIFVIASKTTCELLEDFDNCQHVSKFMNGELFKQLVTNIMVKELCDEHNFELYLTNRDFIAEVSDRYNHYIKFLNTYRKTTTYSLSKEVLEDMLLVATRNNLYNKYIVEEAAKYIMILNRDLAYLEFLKTESTYSGKIEKKVYKFGKEFLILKKKLEKHEQ